MASSVGYLMFQPGTYPSSAYILPSQTAPSSSFSIAGALPPTQSTEDEELSESSDEDSDDEESARIYQEQAERLQHQREVEASEYQKGEEEWVRCGGYIRDRFGRRDMKRTQEIREELALREKERVIMERWAWYLRQWEHVQHDGTVGFVDFPWPVAVEEKKSAPVTLQDLSVQKIQRFFLDPLSVRGNQTSRKSRLRSSLLKWHPDKLSSLMVRVKEEEADKVQSGINLVVMALKQIMTEGKTSA